MLDQSYYTAINRLPKPDTRYIVSLSSGAASAVAADLAINRYGPEAVELVFMDTLWEDADNYRFLADLEKRWGKPITRLTDGRKPLQVADDENIIPNQKIAPCSFRLKIELFREYLYGLRSQGVQPVSLIGFSRAEMHRVKKSIRGYASHGFMVDFPLLWAGAPFDPVQAVKAFGIAPPRMYSQGYSHANCGGRCVRQGQEDWLRTLHLYPERFQEAMVWETAKRKDRRFKDYAFVRDQSNGTVDDLPLWKLAGRYRRGRLSSRVMRNINAWLAIREGRQGVQMGFNWLTDETHCVCNAGDIGEAA